MNDPCARRNRGFATVRPMTVWGHGPGPVSVWIWGPVMLIDPLIDAGERGLAGWLLGLGTLAVFSIAVWAVYHRHTTTGRQVVMLLAAQGVITVVAAAWWGPHWFALFILLALALGAMGHPRWAPPALLTVTLAAGVLVWWRTGNGGQVWSIALTTFLAGFGTYTFHRLLSAIAELNATREELALKAVDQERLRFSRDLHDLLGHTLSVMVVKSEVIRRLLPDDPQAAIIHAGDIETIGRQSLVEVREAVSGYRDADVARELDRAKIALHAAGIVLRIEHNGEPVLPEVDALFGWVVREAVTNVIRHSGARRCDISVNFDGDTAALTVRDDGRGAKPGETTGKGLRGLSERAAAIGGRVDTVQSRSGFTLNAYVPTRQVVAA
jgi:two-component system sensor histidine kinase DesK